MAQALISAGAEEASVDINLGLLNLLMAAASVPPWEYALLLAILSMIFLYHVLDFHIVGDFLSGWAGDAIGLYYDPTSPVSAQLLAKCGTLKKRYWPTPWLCSPHLQTLYLHFFGASPPVDYERQLYITADGGTIALDWVKFPTFTDDGSGEQSQKNLASDETPIAIIIPGLTSSSESCYVKQIAGSLANKGWRVLVANHRGLGGVSITSDQFYNAGWTEDARKIFLHVRRTYCKAPLLAVGTSLGANILVKYLGEEGSRTPLVGGVAICCPWDLVVCDRYMRRNRVQSLYNRALAIGLQQYAQLHQTALSRIADWDLLNKSASVRDFDRTVTRLVGNYETVDTYYRRCSSAQFVGNIAVPLLCISAEDDPICSKEAIPYDECRLNPNVILGVTGHGGHLAYFEGLNATSLWWVRAATEFVNVLLASPHMHQPREVGNDNAATQGSSIDKGPFLTIAKDGKVAAEDSGYDGGFEGTAQEIQVQLSGAKTEGDQKEQNMIIKEEPVRSQDRYLKLGSDYTADAVNDDCGSLIDGPVIKDFQSDSEKDNGTEVDPSTLNEAEPLSMTADVDHAGQPSIRLQLRSYSEVAALRSALSQLLDQVPRSPSIVVQSTQNGLESSPDSSHSTCSPPQSIEVPITSSVVAGFGKCVDATKDLLVNDCTKSKTPANSPQGHTHMVSIEKKEDVSVRSYPLKNLTGLASQNRRILWLLTYVALVTTFPILGPAFVVRTRARMLDILSHHWFKHFR